MLTIGMRDENYRYRGFLKASKVELVSRLNEPDTFIVDVAPAGNPSPRGLGAGSA